MRPVYELVARAVGERLGLPTRLIDSNDFAAFAGGDADVGFICGLPYVRLAAIDPTPVELVAAPQLLGDRYQDRPTYYSDVVVRADAGLSTVAELRGRSWAYNDPDSHSGHLITLYQLLRMGESPDYFGSVVEAGSHQRSIDLVAAGEVDASAIDSQVLALAVAVKPALRSELRVIDSWGPSPVQPVVASTRIDVSLRQEIRRAIQEIGQQPEERQVLNAARVDSFVAIDDGHYDPIRAMLRAVEESGHTRLLPA